MPRHCPDAYASWYMIDHSLGTDAAPMARIYGPFQLRREAEHCRNVKLKALERALRRLGHDQHGCDFFVAGYRDELRVTHVRAMS